MKKIWSTVLFVLVVLLYGCDSRIPETSGMPSVSTESSKAEEQYGSFEDAFPIGCFANKTPEELMAAYTHVIYYNERQMEGVMNTPSSLLIDTMNESVLLSYDKLTGVFANACRDTLCSHESCLLGAFGTRIYYGAEGLLILADEKDETALYHTDFTGANAKKLYSSANMLSYVVQEGEYIYVLEEALDEATDETVGRIIRMQKDGAKHELLLEQADLYYYMPIGGNILYLNSDDGYTLYFTQEKESKPFGSSDMLPVALYGEDFYFLSEGGLYRSAGYGNEEAVLLTERSSIIDLTFDNGMIYFHDGKTVYKTTSDFLEISEFYTVETDERIDNVIVDDGLLFYRYTVRKGSSRKHHFVLVDMENNKTLEVVNE